VTWSFPPISAKKKRERGDEEMWAEYKAARREKRRKSGRSFTTKKEGTAVVAKAAQQASCKHVSLPAPLFSFAGDETVFAGCCPPPPGHRFPTQKSCYCLLFVLMWMMVLMPVVCSGSCTECAAKVMKVF
jgi:ferredoxin-thioredoxin reductase catalytic subunit